MQPIHLDEPKPEEVVSESEVEVSDWFSAPPFKPDDAPWQWLTPERSKELWRLSRYFQRLFDFSGDWFSASQDKPEYLQAFHRNVLSAAQPDLPAFVLHGRDSASFTTVGGFLACWPRLRLLEEEYRGYDVLPLDLSLWLQVVPTGTAHVASRAS